MDLSSLYNAFCCGHIEDIKKAVGTVRVMLYTYVHLLICNCPETQAYTLVKGKDCSLTIYLPPWGRYWRTSPDPSSNYQSWGRQKKLELKSDSKKSRIRETKNLSACAVSSTTVGWTKNTQKPDFFEKRKKIIKNAKTQKRLEICQY